jgi:hypothetical protein
VQDPEVHEHRKPTLSTRYLQEPIVTSIVRRCRGVGDGGEGESLVEVEVEGVAAEVEVVVINKD